ncbi:MAG: hypothetical protein M0Z27_06805 [Thermaerobacter sp.]|jgi:hypothetical protein|nr:hypothetical protein [Thermaerobacter sp.]MDA8145753.1 hypothetical protein [Thermaerobacter sp.]
METVRGRVEELERLGDVSAVYTVALDVGGGGRRVLRFTATRRDLRLAPGDVLEAKVARSPAGEEVMLCRNRSTGQLLVDRVNFQAGRITWWFLGGLLLLWILWSLLH